MRGLFGGALATAILAGVGPAGATGLDIRDAAVRVVVIPEARSDVSVTVLKTNPRLPLRVFTALSGRTIVAGASRTFPFFGGRPMECLAGGGVRVWGAGPVAYEDLPQILVRMPLDAQVEAGGAVFGSVARARGLDLSVGGCGEWTVANVVDQMVVRTSGAVDVRTGAAGRMTLDASGSGRIRAGAAASGLDADIGGAGGIMVGQASGPMRIDASGGGSIQIGGGQASQVDVNVSGAGDVDVRGAADSLRADLSGSGHVTAASVTRRLDADVSGGGGLRVGQASGAISAHMSGSGSLRIAGGHATSFDAHLSGAGDIDYGGVADTLNVDASGSGRVRVARVTGAVTNSTTGASQVIIGR